MKNLSFSKKAERFVLHWILLMVVWIAFTSSFATQELLVGAGVTALISILTISVFTCCELKILNPKSIYYMFVFLFTFLVALVKSNMDVARRVLSPSLPINPGIVKFKTSLKTNFSNL